MTKEISNSQILREAPNLVEYGIKKGYIRKPVNKIEYLNQYFKTELVERKKIFNRRDPFS